ncbi:hypothetical protein [Brevibacillus sp. VP]|uniref:hypothetical protein n=1 Tax=unclassified Brevibacillus TaxID=2684853 RepID=UPI00191C36E5|nr:hypothetical protein [Brevibacillus sp. VP]
MSKFFAVLCCIIFTLGIIVGSMGSLNEAVVKKNGLRDKTIKWIDSAIPLEKTRLD